MVDELTDKIRPLRERDNELAVLRNDLRLDPSACMDVVFVYKELGLVSELRCLGCEGVFEYNPTNRRWVCEECGYQYSQDEVQILLDTYLQALGRLYAKRERRTIWGLVRWFLRLVGIVR